MTEMDPRLRYLMLATHVPASGSGGGVVRYTVALARALAARPDIELHVVATSDGAVFFRTFLPDRQVHRVPTVPVPLLSAAERLGVLPGLRWSDFDVVHGTKHIVPRRAGGARRVLTVHDMLLFDRGQDYPALKRRLLRGPYLASIRDAEVLVCVSRATRARLVDQVPTVADRACVALLAPSPTLVDAEPEPVESLAGIPFALVVGDASFRKNLRLPVGTWRRVREKVPGAVLAVVGPDPWGAEDRGGELWDELCADGAALGLRNVSDGALRWCYENASVVLCPSLLEGFGFPSVEAAAFGAPVVTSEDPALCEAAAGWGRPVATWSADEWVTAVCTAMLAPRGTGSPTRPRTWEQVAADTVGAVRGAPSGAADEQLLEPGRKRQSFRGRTGVSPYLAPVRVRHVVPAENSRALATATRLADEHIRQGWRSEVDLLGVGESTLSSPLHDEEIVVLHGPRAGRVRRQIRGRVPTVVLAGSTPPSGGRLGWIHEASLAKWTNALVLADGAAPGWSRVAAPVTRLVGADIDADEAAAIFVRARAWGAPRGVGMADHHQ